MTVKGSLRHQTAFFEIYYEVLYGYNIFFVAYRQNK